MFFKSISKIKTSLFVILFSQFSFGQLSNFTLTVSKTDEDCTANGTLSFNVSGTTAGATIIYNIYRLPNITTPITSLSTNTFVGLTAGNYQVVATQSLGGLSNSQQQDITILNQIVNLSYQIVSQNVICGNDGKITVNIDSGTAISYELFAGPMIRPLQSSNVFSNLAAGQYSVRVFDSCGEGVVQTYTLGAIAPNVTIGISVLNDPISCNQIPLNFGIDSTPNPNNYISIAYTLNVQITVHPPGGGTDIIYNQIVNSGNSINQTVAFFNGQLYTYDIKITDRCGVIYTANNRVINKTITVSNLIKNKTCIDSSVEFGSVQTLIMISAPASYTATSVPFNLTSGIDILSNTITLNNLPVGNYIFQATDLCGNPQTIPIEIVPESLLPSIGTIQNCVISNIKIENVYSVIMTTAPASYPYVTPYNFTSLIVSNQLILTNVPNGFYQFAVTDACNNPKILDIIISIIPVPTPILTIREGCNSSVGTMHLAGSFITVKIIAAPTSFPFTLPYNASANINTVYNIFTIENLPVGNYIVETTTSNCNVIHNIPFTINGLIETNNTSIIPHCGSFDINLQHSSNNQPYNYWLQKYNSISGQWGHPMTGVPYSTTLDNTTAMSLVNNNINLNIATTGVFRILSVHQIYMQGNPLFYYQTCINTIYNFTFQNQPRIINVYTFSCNNGTYDTVIEAVGVNPLIYRITQKNGLPFVVQNGNSNIFLGLTPANYNFQVEDACGNILNSPYDIPRPTQFVITPTSFCTGNNGSLTLPNFPFLQYQWWKDTNTTNILSTTNSMQFTPFDHLTQSGVYHVRVSFPSNPLSCINSVKDYTISGAGNTANAGIGTSINYCGNQGIINLFSLISGTYDTGGTWTEITASGTLINNIWNASMVATGTYRFKYRVTATCGTIAESFCDITINPIPQTPVATSNSAVCASQSLNLFASNVTGATYSWTGPNSFVSTAQNPIINSVSVVNSGIYTVKSVLNGCDSATSTVTVLVVPLPEFSIDVACISSRMMATATPISNSFNSITATYNWTGPNGFASTANPVDLTGQGNGLYDLLVTNDLGCFNSKPITVLYTTCEIPKGVSAHIDGNNDIFDLSSFGNIHNMKIYNRYGMMVYEFDNYTNQWHGQDKNGNQLPDATYYYYLILDSGIEKTGWVYLAN